MDVLPWPPQFVAAHMATSPTVPEASAVDGFSSMAVDAHCRLATAATAAFLCSAHAGYITAQNVLVDGGLFPGTL